MPIYQYTKVLRYYVLYDTTCYTRYVWPLSLAMRLLTLGGGNNNGTARGGGGGGVGGGGGGGGDDAGDDDEARAVLATLREASGHGAVAFYLMTSPRYLVITWLSPHVTWASPHVTGLSPQASGGTGLMHESFWYDDPTRFTRGWCALASYSASVT